MPYYHVRLLLKSSPSYSYEPNLSEDDVTKLGEQYSRGEKLLFLGEWIKQSDIKEILIRKTSSHSKEYGDFFERGVVAIFRLGKGDDVTRQFITSPPTEKGKKLEAMLSKNVFIVHGRDETQALRLQKYLTKTLEIDAEMFEDFKEKSGSNTIIEQLEYIKDNVSYAFVIVTPDDLGCLSEDIENCRTRILIGRENVTVKSVCDILDSLHTRARQNVVFEHGLFIGALGRDRVCCLLQEDTKEKPSDIDGILYVGFKNSVKETFPEIGEKLKKIGLVKT